MLPLKSVKKGDGVVGIQSKSQPLSSRETYAREVQLDMDSELEELQRKEQPKKPSPVGMIPPTSGSESLFSQLIRQQLERDTVTKDIGVPQKPVQSTSSVQKDATPEPTKKAQKSVKKIPRGRNASRLDSPEDTTIWDDYPTPVKKKKVTAFTPEEKTLVVNSFKYLRKTVPNIYTNHELLEKTSDLTGVDIKTVYDILKEYKDDEDFKPNDTKLKKGTKDVNTLKESHLVAIRQIVHGLYLNEELATLSKVSQKVREDEEIPDISLFQLKHGLKQLKFKHLVRNATKILIERQDVVLWRTNYLNEMQAHREKGRNIYYLDEAWFESDQSSSKKIGTVVACIGNERGLLCENKFRDVPEGAGVDSTQFEPWLKEALQKLQEGDVLVLDDATCHCRTIKKTPTMTWHKEGMVQWLTARKVKVEKGETKSELYAKVKAAKTYQRYYTDKLANSRGVTLMRLPPYHLEINPTTQILKTLKSVHQLKELDVQTWRTATERARRAEELLRRLDRLIDQVVDGFLEDDRGSAGESEYSDSDGSSGDE